MTKEELIIQWKQELTQLKDDRRKTSSNDEKLYLDGRITQLAFCLADLQK
jgi:sugar lactone lactonase YvrE